MAEEIDFAKLKSLHIPIINEIIGIMKDMAVAVPKNYDESKLYPFRRLCLGYLLIAKNNLEAALHLLNNNLTDQINYINRNMFELVVTLYYIADDSDKTEERIERYFEYNDAVLNHKVRNVLRQHSDLLQQELPTQIYESIDQEYKKFRDKYKKKDGKKFNEKTWSGLNLVSMLEALTDNASKAMLLKHYQVVVKCQDIGYPFLMVPYVKTSVTRA